MESAADRQIAQVRRDEARDGRDLAAQLGLPCGMPTILVGPPLAAEQTSAGETCFPRGKRGHEPGGIVQELRRVFFIRENCGQAAAATKITISQESICLQPPRSLCATRQLDGGTEL